MNRIFFSAQFRVWRVLPLRHFGVYIKREIHLKRGIHLVRNSDICTVQFNKNHYTG